MKFVLPALAGFLSWCLIDPAAADDPDDGRIPRVQPHEVESRGDAGTENASTSEPRAFAATIVTGDRSRQFDSPARAMSELQRAVWLKRRAVQEGLAFQAELTVNGVDYQFSDPEQARAACRAVIEALLRLAKVRAALADVGRIPPAAEPSAAEDDQSSGKRPANPEHAMLTIRQRVNEALRQEARRNQGQLPDAERWQQFLAEQIDRARREGLVREALSAQAESSTTADATLEARRQAEIESVREMLSQALGSDSEVEDESPPATAQVKDAE